MKSIVYVGLVIVLVYIFFWTIAYLCLVGRDFQYYWKYLYLSWVGPGEIPAFLHIFAVVATVVIVFVFFITAKLRGGLK